MHLIKIEKYNENMDEATVVEWHKQEGDSVSRGDVLVTVVTDKADVEVEAESGGTLLKIVAPEKSSVPVGYTVGIVGETGSELPDFEAMNKEITQKSALLSALDPGGTEPAARPRAEPAAGKRVPATPAAKRLARKRGIDLAEVKAWAGAKGPVSQEMVEAFLEK